MRVLVRSPSVVTAQSLYGDAIRGTSHSGRAATRCPMLLPLGERHAPVPGCPDGRYWTRMGHPGFPSNGIYSSVTIHYPSDIGKCFLTYGRRSVHPIQSSRWRRAGAVLLLDAPAPSLGVPSGGINTRSHLDIRSLCRAFVAGIRSGCSQRIQRIRGRTFRFLFVRPSLL